MAIKSRLILEKGLTMIELLVAATFLTVLASGVIVIINPLQKMEQARDGQRKSDLNQLQKALETYYQDYGEYPQSNSNKINGINWGNPWTPYIPLLPKDPKSPRNYVYYTPNAGANCANYQCYYLFANLERGINDKQICNPNTTNPCDSATLYGLGNACGGATYKCIFGVSSPNVTP